MSRREGHEDCRSCTHCGLTNCTDCDTSGQACTCTAYKRHLDEWLDGTRPDRPNRLLHTTQIA